MRSHHSPAEMGERAIVGGCSLCGYACYIIVCAGREASFGSLWQVATPLAPSLTSVTELPAITALGVDATETSSAKPPPLPNLKLRSLPNRETPCRHGALPTMYGRYICIQPCRFAKLSDCGLRGYCRSPMPTRMRRQAQGVNGHVFKNSNSMYHFCGNLPDTRFHLRLLLSRQHRYGMAPYQLTGSRWSSCRLINSFTSVLQVRLPI